MMKQFLAVFLGSPQSKSMQKWQNLSEEQRQQKTAEGMKAWEEWGKSMKNLLFIREDL